MRCIAKSSQLLLVSSPRRQSIRLRLCARVNTSCYPAKHFGCPATVGGAHVSKRSIDLQIAGRAHRRCEHPLRLASRVLGIHTLRKASEVLLHCLRRTRMTFTLLLAVCSCFSVTTASMAEAPVGEWKSPISSELIVSQSIRLGSPVVAQDGSLVWSEGRPTEGGRQVLVRR